MTLEDPAVVGVPEIEPDVGSTVSPAGSPVADQVRVAVDEVSVPVAVRETGAPDTEVWFPGLVTATVLVTVQMRAAWPEKPAESVAVRTTLEDPAVDGVPEMVPFDGFTMSPTGSPVADQVRVAVDEESVAEAVRETGEPETEAWFPRLVTATVLVTVQVKAAWPEKPAESMAVRTTLQDPAVVGVPEMVPFDGFTLSPTGRPEADQVRVAVDEESVAEAVRETGEPEAEDWFPGKMTATELMTVQMKAAWPEKPAESVAVRTTSDTPAVDGVPVILPVEELTEVPGGRPDADQVTMLAVDEVSVAVAPRETGVPESEFCAGVGPTVTRFVRTTGKVVEPAYPLESVAVRVTESEPAVVGIPVIRPDDGLMVSPEGRPVADQDTMVAVPDESWADEDRLNGVPVVKDWVPGLDTVTALPIPQTNTACPLYPALSTTVTVTWKNPPWVGVPVTFPVVEPIDSPVGSPVAVNPRVANTELSVAWI